MVFASLWHVANILPGRDASNQIAITIIGYLDPSVEHPLCFFQNILG
jgi:hypothetical protein